MFPQYFSTDRRYARLSLKALSLFPLLWSNADDQGRLTGDPEEIKYAVCPNIDHITKSDTPELLDELTSQQLIKVYNTPKGPACQMLDWWEVNHKMQWAYPSDYPAMNGWKDRLRYKKGREHVVSENWSDSGELSGEPDIPSSGEPSLVSSGESSGELGQVFPPDPLLNKLNQRVTKKSKSKSNIKSPECSGELPSHSPRASPSEKEILTRLTSNFEKGWGHVQAADLENVIPRRASAREAAQLRDLAKEIYSAGGCSLDYIDQAFRESSGQNKHHISYVRVVLLDWMGVPRERSP
jgi:hypothetical protein